MKKNIILVLMTVFFVSCAKEEKVQISLNFDENLSFRVVKFITKNQEFTPLMTQENPNINFKKNNFFGNLGCNNFFGSFTFENEKLTIINPAATKMMCDPAIMSFENNFLVHFNGEFKLSEEGNLVILQNEAIKIYLTRK